MSYTKKIFFFDIETFVPNDEDILLDITNSVKPPKNYSSAQAMEKWHYVERPQKVDEALSSAALNPLYAVVACISYIINDEEPKTLLNKTFDITGEREMLNRLFSMDILYKAPLLVGHNIYGFDLPFLRSRCMVHGLNHKLILPDVMRYSNPMVFDTMLQWYPKKFESLNRLAKVFGLSQKTSSGDHVREMILGNKIDDLISYSEQDVIIVKDIYRRMS